MGFQEPGQSSDTPVKQEHLREFFDVHMTIVREILKKPNYIAWAHPAYVYVDLNAGPGRYLGCDGSPVIAADVAIKKGLPVDIWCCEENPTTMAQLQEVMGPYQFFPGVNVRFLLGDHNDTITKVLTHYRRPVYGLAYFDPNPKPLNVDLLGKLARHRLFNLMDILAYIAANSAYKRTRHLTDGRFFSDDIAQIGKDKCFLRPPTSKHQWTFAFMTGYKVHPEIRKIPLIDMQSPRGQEILTLLDFKKSERQESLPFLLSQPTVAMRSISAIHDSALYGRS